MSSKNHRKVVDQVAAAGIQQHAIDMQKARGTDVGSRVRALPQPGLSGDAAADRAQAVPEKDTQSSEDGRLQ
jgi:putative Holliday junction resolvase